MSAHSIFPQCQGVSKDKLQYEGVCSKTLGSGLGNCWNCGYTWCFSTKSIDSKQSLIDIVLLAGHLLHLKNLRGSLHRLCLLLSCTLYEVNSDLYLDELILWLAIEHGIKASVSALHSTLVKVGLTQKLLHKVAIERNEELHEQWREMQVSNDFHHDGSQLVCIHETSKNELTSARKWLCLLWRTCWVERCIFSWRQILTCYSINCWWLYYQQCCPRLLWLNGLPWIHSGNDSVFPDELPQTNTDSWKLPQMNPYLAPQSVLILDNWCIHHSEALLKLVRVSGCLIPYLPVYSPDLNLIATSFSTQLFLFIFLWNIHCTVKADLLIFKNMGMSHNKTLMLYRLCFEACGCVTASQRKEQGTYLKSMTRAANSSQEMNCKA